MNIISIDRLSKTLGKSPLFSDASLGIDSGEHIGLVGPNGSGKSSFLRLLCGDLEPDSGTIGRKRGLRLAYLPQRPGFKPDDRLADFFTGEPDPAPFAKAVERPAHGADPRLTYESLCSELGLPDQGAMMAKLSGGMVKKAALARAFASGAELVLLDEPTNHLDIETIEWLEKRLRAADFAFIVVTHDRWFLDSVCDAIMDIDRASISKYEGSYSDYLERLAEREAALEKAESRRLARLKIERAWLMRGARARAGKSERRKTLIRQMEGSALERPAAREAFSSMTRRIGKKVLELREVCKSYGGPEVIAPFSFEIGAFARIGLIGPNGSGKTTLLDMIAGRLDPDSGQILRGQTVSVACFDQNSSTLDPTMRLIDYAGEKADRIRMRDAAVLSPERLLERFGFPRSMHELSLSRLSGGELRRLHFVRLLTESPNLLVLDEPTNDLDINSIEMLEDFLSEFEGSVLAVSHDRAFLDRVADFLLVFDGHGGIREYPGRYADYRDFREAADFRSREAPGADSGAKNRDTRRRERKGLSWSEERELESLLEEISGLEREKSDLELLFAAATVQPAALEAASRRYAELGPLIGARTARWEDLESRRE